MAELLAARSRAAARADMVELRLDGVKDVDLAAALEGGPRPLIVTCRPSWEGGRFDGSEEERQRLLGSAIRSSAEFVDLEWRSRPDALVRARQGRGVVLSMHDFGGMPADLDARVRAMAGTGAEVLKIAVRVGGPRDLIALLDLRARYPELTLVLIGLGFRGWPTRVLASRFGSVWMYAGGEDQAGQLDVATLLDTYRFRGVGPSTAVYGVAGDPLAHSLSPAMHNAGFSGAGLDAVYVPFESDAADDLLALADRLCIQGWSVTAPLKRRFADLISNQDAACRHAGALNTLKRTLGGWEATNTDLEGFLAPLAATELRGLRCTVLGAGGAARAVVAALRGRRAVVTVSARRADEAARLAGPDGKAEPYPPPAASWDLLVNATPVGTWPRHEETPVPADRLEGGGIVYDLVYNPPETRLLREAASAGCRTIGGLAMLVAQAERQFEWWTGRAPDPGVFRRAAEAGFEYATNHV
jgi:3-dehydroquinate dehydratase/shikimate dehydrogenase